MTDSESFIPLESEPMLYSFDDNIMSAAQSETKQEAELRDIPAAPAPPPVQEPEPEPRHTKVQLDFIDETPLQAEADVDLADEAYLHRLAQKEKVSFLPLGQSSMSEAIIVHCERMIGENRPPRPPTTVSDLRKLLMLCDDFALENRPAQANAYDIDGGTAGLLEGLFNDEELVFDRVHQLLLFIARMRLLQAMQVAKPDVKNASVLFGDPDSPGKRVSDDELFRWVTNHKICHLSLVKDGKFNLRTCTLEQLWRTMLMCVNQWPWLPYEAPLIRFFDELRCRIAVFLCHREEAFVFQAESDSDESDSDNSGEQEKVLGLDLEMFGLTDLGGVMHARREAPDTGRKILIDNWQLATRTKSDVTFAHINMEFIDECERITHAMQMSLRSQAGFRTKQVESDKCGACAVYDRLFKAQKQTPIVDLISPEDEARMIKVLSATISDASAGALDEQFKTEIFDMYLKPSELDHFKEFHPEETETAQACIARCRIEDFHVLSKKYLEKDCKEAWLQCGLKDEMNEPAHYLLAGLTLNFMLRQEASSLQFEYYYVRFAHIQPFMHKESRDGETRQLLNQVYEPLTTTGTMRLRYQLMSQHGAGVNHAELNYEHPLIVQALCSHMVLYRGHLHKCRSLEHAFLVWLAIMCLDKHIGGITHNESPLQPIAQKLLPSLQEPLQRSYELTLKRQQKYANLAKTAEPVPDFPQSFTTHFH
jgi:hypothetical protein